MASVIRGSGESTLGGALDVQGVLTYEDVTSVDAVGIITARSGIVIDTQDTSATSLSIGSKGGGANDGHLEGEGPKINFLATRGDDGANGSAAYIQQKAIGDLGSSYPVDLAFGVRRFGSPIEAMRIVSTGNVGIGTDNPTAALHVLSTAYPTATITRNHAVNYPRLRLVNAANDGADLDGIGDGTGGFRISCVAAGVSTERLRITSSGQVSIGNNPTVASDAALHIELDGTREYLRLEGDGEGSNAYFEIEAPNNRRKAIIFKSGGTRRGVIGVGDSDEASATSLFLSASTNIAGNDPHMVINSDGAITTPTNPYSQWKITCNVANHVRTLTEYQDRGSNVTSKLAGNGSSHGSVGRFTAPVTGAYLFTIASTGRPGNTSELLVLYGSWTGSTTNSYSPNVEIIDTRGAAATGNVLQEDGASTVFTLYLAASDYLSLDWYRTNTSYLGTTIYTVSATLLG